MKNKLVGLIVLAMLAVTRPGYAQLNKVFADLFEQVLRKDLQLTFGAHSTHFVDAAAEANRVLTPGLNSLIASNISSFPLTSTIAGLTYDFSSGRPVPITGSLGPIFAETAETLGKGKLNVGFEFSHLSLNRFRGLPTRDIRFTFAHKDIVENGRPLGDDPFELDVIDLNLNLDVNANIYAFFATFGVTNNLDIGVAVPLVNVSLQGTAQAIVRGPASGTAHTFVGGTQANPNVVDRVSYDDNASGVGDVAVRLKYSFVRGVDLNLGALLDVRLPTGNEEDFLGTGETSTKLSLIASRKIAQFTPHLNLGYDRRSAKLDSDELEFTAGLDQKLAEGFTLAVDILGEIDVNSDEAIKFFPQETVTLADKLSAGSPNITINRLEDLTSIPQRDNDNMLSASLGFRIAPSEKVLLLGNILIPMNDGGLRSSVAPTLGLTVNF